MHYSGIVSYRKYLDFESRDFLATYNFSVLSQGTNRKCKRQNILRTKVSAGCCVVFSNELLSHPSASFCWKVWLFLWKRDIGSNQRQGLRHICQEILVSLISDQCHKSTRFFYLIFIWSCFSQYFSIGRLPTRGGGKFVEDQI